MQDLKIKGDDHEYKLFIMSYTNRKSFASNLIYFCRIRAYNFRNQMQRIKLMKYGAVYSIYLAILLDTSPDHLDSQQKFQSFPETQLLQYQRPKINKV